MMTRRTAIFLFYLLLLQGVLTSVGAREDTCVVKKLEVERLPSLIISRAGHQVFYANGELTVAGGHTDGFVPTNTVEYYQDGEWHQLQMVYTHDVGYSVVMNNGKVLLGGGCQEPIGIGQTFLAELYDPTTHSFTGFGSMERKRTMASALELDSGRVLIAGNWYHDDGIELFDGQKHFTYIKDVAVNGACPHIFRIAADDAIVLSATSNRGDTLRLTYVERLKGDTLHVPLLETWHPLPITPHCDAESFIGDEAKGLYSYLLPIEDDHGQAAVARVDNGVFSLLPTAFQIPMRTHWGDEIDYCYPIIVDRQSRRAYMMGIDRAIHTHPDLPHRFYVVAIDYAQAGNTNPAHITLYYTDPLPTVPDFGPVLTPEGNLLVAGGYLRGSNFEPSNEVLLLRLGKPQTSAATSVSPWLWVVLGLVVLLLLLLLGYVLVKRLRSSIVEVPAEVQVPSEAYEELMQRIRQLMEEQKVYTNPDLKLTDVARQLNTNSRYISESVKMTGCNFSQFVNTYRVEHAKRLMRSKDDLKLSFVWSESGFASEQTFHRSFKQITGLTPGEWKSGK